MDSNLFLDNNNLGVIDMNFSKTQCDKLSTPIKHDKLYEPIFCLGSQKWVCRRCARIGERFQTDIAGTSFYSVYKQAISFNLEKSL